MAKKLAIYIPTYKRPEVLQGVVDNILSTTKNSCTIYLGVEPDDLPYPKVKGAKVLINEGVQGYSDTLQTLYEHSDEEFYFPANDDFRFLPDWDVVPVEKLEANPELMVIGLSDGNPSTNYWTINMVRRAYISEMSGVVDMPNRVLYPYHHNFSDTEFAQTARMRGVWDYHDGPAIQHIHPGFAAQYGLNPWSDPTYDKNNATANADAEVYTARKHLFT